MFKFESAILQDGKQQVGSGNSFVISLRVHLVLSMLKATAGEY